ncbi:MAG: hypothetical protein Q7U91_03070 [Sideroxyarcus sp.]|nr:hypothetical protein [Sideroxyarcus sp.]
MKTLFMSIFAVQIAAYLLLGWFHFFSRQNAQIPASYIVLHIVAALNLIFLVFVIWSLFTQGPSTWTRSAVLWLSLPPIIGVVVLFTIKMVHRWL